MKLLHLSYSYNLLAHWRKLADAVALVGANANVDFETLRVEVTKGDKYLEFAPIFAAPGKTLVEIDRFDELQSRAVAFCGWHLAQEQTLPFQNDKLEFKKYCLANGLATPKQVDLDDAHDGVGFVIKKEIRNQLERGACHGPCAVGEAKQQLKAEAGWFFEEFVQGDSLEAWYWNNGLYCVDRRTWPFVVGDGQSTIKRLVEAKFALQVWALLNPVLRWQGMAADTVLPAGSRAILSFRYQTYLHSPARTSENALDSIRGTEIYEQLRFAGHVFAKGMNGADARNLPFRVSCVVDGAQRVWFNSLHGQPDAHPDIYSEIFAQIFGIAVPVSTPRMEVAPANWGQ